MMLWGRANRQDGERNRLRLSALDRAFAVIEFGPDGTIRDANGNFLAAMGYRLDEIVGKHHRIFMDPAEARQASYEDFWRTLRAGDYVSGAFRRLRKDGTVIWLQAAYTPVRDATGQVAGVVKIASDVTGQKARAVDSACQLDGISASQAVIEFRLDGTIVTANETFLRTLRYGLDDIRGKHHSMFVHPSERGAAYEAFWQNLRSGTFQQGQFRRIAGDGSDVYILATYTPIVDETGTVTKVVKFATDITPWVKALETLRRHLDRLAEGDLDCLITDSFARDYEPIRERFNAMAGKIGELVGSISRISGEIAASMAGIARSAEELSTRSESQAASLEETSATMEQMTASGRSNADGSRKAQSLAHEATQEVAAGRRVASEAVDAMRRIRESADRIEGITALIQDIATQTNLLALNASVEAARAGDSGKGFAVVAAEVRALAQRAGESVKNISALLRESGTHIDNGVGLVARTDQSLERSAGVIDTVSSTCANIATATNEQAAGIEEVSTAVRALDQITQQNAAMSDKVSNDREQLTRQTQELESLVGYFHGGGRAADGGRASRAA